MTKTTGWPPGLLQDDCKKLSQWFASRLDARHVVRKVCAEIRKERNKTMDRETVIQLASKAGIAKHGLGFTAWEGQLERFANAIEQQTLERAASMCDKLEDKAEESRAFQNYADAQKEGDMDYEISRGKHWMTVNMYNTAVKKCAAAIRALKPSNP